MNDEENRLNTFSGWPVGAPVDPGRVARGGFYSTGQGLEVLCFSCGGSIADWAFGDQVMARHRRLDPLCPFVRDPLSSGNLPLGAGRPTDSPEPPAEPHAAPLSGQQDPEEESKDTIYKADMLRLLSFNNWPVSFISAEEMALAGFYHLRDEAPGDRVRCAWCGGELQRWLRGDQPLAEHLRHFPHCSYAQARLRLASAMDNKALAEGQAASAALGIVPGGGAGGPPSVQARLQTFPASWPAQRRQQPAALAAAGFSYAGGDDQVKCFHCSGELCRWQDEDDPWVEHARWFPHCGFLQLARGAAFVQQHRLQLAPGRPLEDALQRCMDGPLAAAALACGLQPHTVRTAYRRRLQDTRTPFHSTEALIDAALNEQVNESSLGEPESHEEAAPPAEPRAPPAQPSPPEPAPAPVSLTIEEENRRLKEARLCKVCMDAEVGAVFLPCGHLLSCVQCAPCLTTCPLCRSQVKGVVRTYLS